MPTIDDRPRSQSARPGRDPWQAGVVRTAAIVIAIPLWIGACAPINNSAPPNAAGASSPIAVEPLPGPINLAPGITGAPIASSAPKQRPALPHAPAVAVAAPAPPPEPSTAVATPTPAPTPADVVPIPTGRLPSCPPGTIAMWSEPDVVGARVGICHALNAPQ